MKKWPPLMTYLLGIVSMIGLVFIAGIIQRQINGLPFQWSNHLFPSFIAGILGAVIARILILQKKDREQKELLELQHQTIRKFVREITHDLRSPIGAVSNLSELLLMEEESFPEEHREIIRSIKESSDHMLEELNRILDSIKKNYSSEDLTIITLDIVQNIRHILVKLKPLFEKKKITYKFQTHQDSLIIPYSAAKFRSAFTNLITNAIKFSGQNSQVKVALQIVENNFLKITITDSGQGLTAADKEKAFQKYQKLSASPTQGEPTSGLGLYLVKNSVQEMGGEVGVESGGKGLGATFWFTMPLGPLNGANV